MDTRTAALLPRLALAAFVCLALVGAGGADMNMNAAPDAFDRMVEAAEADSLPDAGSNETGPSVGNLEAVMNWLTRFKTDIDEVRRTERVAEDVRAAECNATLEPLLNSIHNKETEMGRFNTPDEFLAVNDQIVGAVDDVRHRYFKLASKAELMAGQLLAASKRFEAQRNSVQDIEDEHSAIADQLDDLRGLVRAHRTKGPTTTGAPHGKPVPQVESLVEIAEQAARAARTAAAGTAAAKEMSLVTDALAEATRQGASSSGGGDGAWHDEVLRLSHKVASAVEASRMHRTRQPRANLEKRREEVQVLHTQLEAVVRDRNAAERALKAGVRAQLSLQERHEYTKKQKHRLEREVRGLQVRVNTTLARCTAAHTKWAIRDGANGDSIQSIDEMYDALAEEKSQEETKLASAVAFSSSGN